MPGPLVGLLYFNGHSFNGNRTFVGKVMSLLPLISPYFRFFFSGGVQKMGGMPFPKQGQKDMTSGLEV